jgi:hypothetical protein
VTTVLPRSKYVPSNLVALVRAGVARGEQVEAVLREISAINAELPATLSS